MYLRPRCKALLIALLGCVLPVPWQGLHAADWSCSPSIEIAEEYNSNILLGSIYELEDFITRVTPGVGVVGIAEQTQFLFDSTFPAEIYIKHDGFNTIDNRSLLSLRNQWTPVYSTNLGAHFIKDTTFETELETTGLREDRTDRMRYGFDVEGGYLSSERASFTISGSVEKSHFPDARQPDALRWRVGLNPARILTPGKTIGLNVDYSNTDYDTSTTIQTVSGTVYWQHELSEKAHYSVGAGYYYTWINREAFGLKSEDDGFLFNVALDNSWTERFSTVLSAGSNQYDTVDARSVVRTYAQASLRYRFSLAVSGGLAFGYSFSTESGLLGKDSHYLRVEPSVRWEFTTQRVLAFLRRLWEPQDRQGYRGANRRPFSCRDRSARCMAEAPGESLNGHPSSNHQITTGQTWNRARNSPTSSAFSSDASGGSFFPLYSQW